MASTSSASSAATGTLQFSMIPPVSGDPNVYAVALLQSIHQEIELLHERIAALSQQYHDLTRGQSNSLLIPPTLLVPQPNTAQPIDNIQAVQQHVRQQQMDSLQQQRAELESAVWTVLRNIVWFKACSSGTSAEFAKHATELESKLLPLVVQLERISEQPANRSAELANEIAHLDDDFKLVLTESNFFPLLSSSSKTHVSKVIAVCGDTHVGKSTLISELLGESECKPDVAGPQQSEPTTANVHYFDAAWTPVESKVRFLDFEGENGGRLPKWLNETFGELLDKLSITEYQEKRRRAVSENLARLAFVMTNIVIFVWNESFANASYLQRVAKLVHNSVESVDSAISPALILIYNKCGLDECFDVEQATAQFFSNPENENLLNLYSEVKCVAIPHKDQVKKIRREGLPPYIIDGEEIFKLQMGKLKDLIGDICQRQLTVREQHGLLFSDYVWSILFREVLARFGEKLRMGQILGTILKPHTLAVAQALDFFLSTYRFGKLYNKEQFLRCRESAFDMLACLIATNIRDKQEIYDRFIITHLKSASFRESAIEMYNELHQHIHKLSPCEAYFPQQRPGEPPAYCTQEQICHAKVHRTTTKINAPSTADSLLTRVEENFKYALSIGYKPTWNGAHQFSYPRLIEEEQRDFLEKLQMIAQAMPSSFFLTKVNALQYATSSAKRKKLQNQSDFCWICLINLPNVKLNGCKHVFCSSCIKVLSTIVEGSAGVGDQTFLVSPDKCPICEIRFTRSEDNPPKSIPKSAEFARIFGDAKPLPLPQLPTTSTTPLPSAPVESPVPSPTLHRQVSMSPQNSPSLPLLPQHHTSQITPTAPPMPVITLPIPPKTQPSTTFVYGDPPTNSPPTYGNHSPSPSSSPDALYPPLPQVQQQAPPSAWPPQFNSQQPPPYNSQQMSPLQYSTPQQNNTQQPQFAQQCNTTQPYMQLVPQHQAQQQMQQQMAQQQFAQQQLQEQQQLALQQRQLQQQQQQMAQQLALQQRQLGSQQVSQHPEQQQLTRQQLMQQAQMVQQHNQATQQQQLAMQQQLMQQQLPVLYPPQFHHSS
ncbi:hypothetical protein Pelo_6293 [Pelomyxa schiedti]|nr:hypothetical protein Pelo_6293 [Pelomyxa schiedti]